MANVLPEVIPHVSSMPTQGWFCQTSGKARKRVTQNTSTHDDRGIYTVAGVPGFTHNSSAVVSVTADYSRYRDSDLVIGDNIWSVGSLDYPIGMLTDSIEPDNAEERYDRAIEKCVGEISLFPENCTGHIREPCRSIGEIRTLVAPKAALSTLTYIDETGGWRIPNNEDDQNEDVENAVLKSLFPDVKVSVLPREKIMTATLNLADAPSSLYIDQQDRRYKILEIIENSGKIGYRAFEHRIYKNVVQPITDKTEEVENQENNVLVAQQAVAALPGGDPGIPAAQAAVAAAQALS